MELNRLIGKRKEFGLTQKQMADMLGMSKSAYVLKENGATQFTVSELEDIAGLLNCSVNFFAKANTKKVMKQ